MPVTGRKPKPEDQRRNRVKPRHDWVEYPDVPFDGGPALPVLMPPPRRRGRTPEPPRPLGAAGRDLWNGLALEAWDEADRRRLLLICEGEDERAALRYRVLSGDGDRQALRLLDAQVYSALNGWCDRHTDHRLMRWPRPTHYWWDGVRTLPHAVAWTPADWRYAIDTAYVHARVMTGDDKLWPELRARERVIGTTADARRDLRIRYVPPAPESTEPPATVTAMAAYRQALDG
jgi:hypothetical protein